MVTLEQRRERLTILQQRLREVEDRWFAMRTYGYHPGHHRPEEDNYCGSTACVLGHAAMIPALQKQGLRMVWSFQDDASYVSHFTLDGSERGFYGDDIGPRFFGLSYEETARLFFYYYAGREDQIRYLDTLIASEQVCS